MVQNLEGDQVPPTYTESSTPDALPPTNASSSSSAPSPTLSPPTNFLTVFRQNDSVKAVFTIDPSMARPPGAVACDGDDGKPLNMRVASHNGAVDAVVELAPTGDFKGPARLQADSRNGRVTVTVHDQRKTRFRLKAASANGAVSVHIPTTFLGTVSTWRKNGRLTFSPGIQARLTTFYEQDDDGRFFIGDYASSGYVDDETWLGDHLHVHSENGGISVEFVDEDNVPSSRRGLFRRMFSG